MKFCDLPEHVLLVIFDKLNLYSLLNLHQACPSLKALIILSGRLASVFVRADEGVKSCRLLLTTLATKVTLQLDVFSDIAAYLEELDLSAVTDLDKTALLEAGRQLQCLKTLNVSYTPITIPDLNEFYELCPTIKNVSINFAFQVDHRGNGQVTIPNDAFERAQTLFTNFHNVELVGSMKNLIESKFVVYIFSKATSLHELKLNASIFDQKRIVNELEQDEDYTQNNFLKFHHLFLYMHGYKTEVAVAANDLFHILDDKDLVHVIIDIYDNDFQLCEVHTSPRFTNFFVSNFGHCVPEMIPMSSVPKHSVQLFWNETVTKFDASFYAELLKRVRLYFPTCHQFPPSNSPAKIARVCNEGEVIWLKVNFDKHLEENSISPEIERMKEYMHAKSHVLDLDYLSDEINLKLGIKFEKYISASLIELSTDSSYLKKITFLSLSGIADYSIHFFDVLFKCCDNLVTLNMETVDTVKEDQRERFPALMCRSLKYGLRLKNLRFTMWVKNFQALMLDISECKQLENIHVCNTNCYELTGSTDLSVIVRNCPNLYSICLCIGNIMDDEFNDDMLKSLVDAKINCNRPYLNIEFICRSEHEYGIFPHDPFLGQFVMVNPL